MAKPGQVLLNQTCLAGAALILHSPSEPGHVACYESERGHLTTQRGWGLRSARHRDQIALNVWHRLANNKQNQGQLSHTFREPAMRTLNTNKHI